MSVLLQNVIKGLRLGIEENRHVYLTSDECRIILESLAAAEPVAYDQREVIKLIEELQDVAVKQKETITKLSNIERRLDRRKKSELSIEDYRNVLGQSISRTDLLSDRIVEIDSVAARCASRLIKLNRVKRGRRE